MAFSTSKEHDEALSEINITPLVDVMLVLLVVFIVTAPLLNHAIPLKLPQTTNASPSATPGRTVDVSIDAHGQVFVDRQPLRLHELAGRLQVLKAAAPGLSVDLRADTALPYGTVAQALAAVEHAGISKLSVLTTPASATPRP